MGKITADGVFLEQLEADPAQYLPEVTGEKLGGDVVKVFWISARGFLMLKSQPLRDW